MAHTYEYPLSAFIDGDINNDRLMEEIKAVPALVDVVSVTKEGWDGDVDIVYPTALSNGDKALLDGVIAVHRDTAHWLPDQKQLKFRAIDKRTNELIAGGFTYQGAVYELYIPAQIRLLGMLVMAQYLTYPILYNSKDDNTVLTINGPSDVQALAVGALGSIAWILNSGTNLKSLVRDATTIAEVQAVVDPR